VKVQVREIPCHRAFEIDEPFVASAIAELPMRRVLIEAAEGAPPDAGQARAELDFYLEGENVFARGPLDGHVVVACGRCLGPARIPLHEKLAVTFLPRSQVPEDVEEPKEPDEETEAKFAEDDVDVYPYDEDEVDLQPLFREQLILAVPYAPLCREDCAGLCTVCGVDLNRESCSCDRRVIDPRLAALKDLKV
jgi:uncharacterized protein